MLVTGDEIQIGKFRLVFLTRPTTAETRTFRWICACAYPEPVVKSCSARVGRRPSMLSWSARSSSDFGYEPAILEGCGERNRDRWGGYFATDLEGHLHTTVELNML